jgi:Raf kinase inhibitor-like YbhB/YbcL family protein
MPQTNTRTADKKRSLGALRVTSSAFQDGSTIPERYTGNGDDESPPLRWTEPPPGTASFAVLCEDPDAPTGNFIHWLAWGIPADARTLPEAIDANDESLRQGENGFGESGYRGPKPPPGKPHRYVFRVFALDTEIDLPPGAQRSALQQKMAGHVLAEGRITGLYGRR